MALTRLGTNAITTVPNSAITLDAAEIPNLDTAKITSGTFADARISEASVTQHVTPFDPAQLEMNLAVLAFKVASANQLAKFSMVDQVIDEYQDATGIDAGASTNENAGGATTSKYYEGGSTVIPDVSLTGAGNATTIDGDYSIDKFIIDGTYETDTTLDVEYLVVGGGASVGGYRGGRKRRIPSLGELPTYS